MGWTYLAQSAIAYIAGLFYMVSGERVAALLCFLIGVVCSIGSDLEDKS